MNAQRGWELAPAKINLFLHVIGRRDDGFHELESLVAFADIGDRLRFEPGGDWRLTIEGPFAAALSGEADNLVLRAARAYETAFGIAQRGTFILEKNLPVASGIGGGSADAAAALRLLHRFSGEKDREHLGEIAAVLGSDVPVCLQGRAAIISGRGETVMPADVPPLHAVLVNPGVAISTREIFQLLAAPPCAGAHATMSVRLTEGDVLAFLQAQHNDLEPSALQLAPAIADCLAALQQTDGCLLARMSGSGATVFGLFGTAAGAEASARALAAGQPGWWVKATALR